MKLINNKRFNAQYNRYFSEGFLMVIFLFSILVGLIAALLLPYDINKPHKGINISGFLIFLGIMLPSSYDTERLKKEISYFVSLNYLRKEYFKNKIILFNLAIGVLVIFSTVIMFIMLDYSKFGYLGFIMEKNFISFLKVSFINIIICNLIYTFIIMIQILFIKVISNKVGNFMFLGLWIMANFIFWYGLSDIYINILSPNITLTCSIVFICIIYYAYYKFIMSLDA